MVLEARDRVGGRTLTLPAADGTPIDHGGQWIGPTQDRMTALAERMGVTTYPTWERGLNTEFRDGQAIRFDGHLPNSNDPVSAVAMGQAIRELDAMAALVPLEAPWAAGDALAWDSQTVETWLQARVSSEQARIWLRAAIRGTLAAEARDLSCCTPCSSSARPAGWPACSPPPGAPRSVASTRAPRPCPSGWPSRWAGGSCSAPRPRWSATARPGWWSRPAGGR